MKRVYVGLAMLAALYLSVGDSQAKPSKTSIKGGCAARVGYPESGLDCKLGLPLYQKNKFSVVGSLRARVNAAYGQKEVEGEQVHTPQIGAVGIANVAAAFSLPYGKLQVITSGEFFGGKFIAPFMGVGYGFKKKFAKGSFGFATRTGVQVPLVYKDHKLRPHAKFENVTNLKLTIGGDNGWQWHNHLEALFFEGGKNGYLREQRFFSGAKHGKYSLGVGVHLQQQGNVDSKKWVDKQKLKFVGIEARYNF